MSDASAYCEKAFADGFVDRLTTALWVFDFDEQCVLWANKAALGVWQADSIDALRARNLGADMSSSVRRRLNQYREDFLTHDAEFSELWTLYPGDIAVTLRVIFRSFRLEDGRMAMLCEGLETEAIDPSTLRSADALLHTSVMISLFHRNGKQLYRNPAARITYGGAPRMLADQFSDPEDYQALEDTLDSGGVAKLMAKMRTSEGICWHEVTAFCCKDPVTGDVSMLVSEIDISEMKAAEQRLRGFASISSDWFWEMDSDLRFSFLSDRAQELSGTDIEATLGKSRKDVVMQMDDNWLAHFDDLRHRRSFRDFRYAKRGADGEIYHLSINGLPIFDQDGVFTGYRGTGTNITERVETEEKIAKQRELEVALVKEREINGLQRQFVSMVSHEFRTPLAVIDGCAQRIVRKLDKLTPERITESLQKVRHSVARLTELMESVLNAARLEEGRITFEPQVCDLIAIVREICESYHDVYPSHEFNVDIDHLPDQITADPRLLRQVVSNLISNAVKYSPKDTRIWIRGEWYYGNDALRLSVQDEGYGIPESELSRLCDRFFRASTSTGIAGTGIGLHLCQHFVALHGGTIKIESIEGQGSTFTLCIPLTASSEAAELVDETAKAQTLATG